MNDCIFCKIAEGKIPAKKIYEDESVLAFNDITPQAPVHVLIIPKKHLDGISSLEEGHIELAGEMMLAAKKIAKEKGLEKGGYRIVANCGKDAGQAVLHMHMHLLGGRKFGWPPG